MQLCIYIFVSPCKQGRVKEVMENYTLKFTPPTRGFDSHVSEQIKTVTAATSSFLAFERTQVKKENPHGT